MHYYFVNFSFNLSLFYNNEWKDQDTDKTQKQRIISSVKLLTDLSQVYPLLEKVVIKDFVPIRMQKKKKKIDICILDIHAFNKL